MTLIILIVACIIGAFIGSRLACLATGGGFIPKALKPKPKTPDYDIIEQLEELNQIEGRTVRPGRLQDKPREIEGLAGYKTKIRRDNAGDLKLELINPRGSSVSTGWVFCKDYVDIYASSKSLLSATALEKRVKERFDEMIAEEKAKVSQEAHMSRIINKFNDRPVDM